jgi:hypothetical protein
MTVTCHRCSRQTSEERIAFRATCGCGAWLHCCRNCEFFAPGRANDCREPRAEAVADREHGNFCEWFRASAAPAAAAPGGRGTATAARTALDALFAKKP